MLTLPWRYRLRKPTYRKRGQPQFSVRVGWSERVRSDGGTLNCGYSPDSTKISSARLMTASGGNTRFRNQTLGKHATHDVMPFDSHTHQWAFRPIGKGHLYRCRPEIWCTDAVQLCQSLIVQQLHTVGTSFFLHLRQPWKVIVLSIADTSAILRTISLGRSQSLSRLIIGQLCTNVKSFGRLEFLSFFLVHFNKKQYLCISNWKPIRSYVAPRRPRKNDEAVESLIRNPSSKTDFRPIGNQQVITNLMFPALKPPVSFRLHLSVLCDFRFVNNFPKPPHYKLQITV